jgi:hypothetical protein
MFDHQRLAWHVVLRIYLPLFAVVAIVVAVAVRRH